MSATDEAVVRRFYEEMNNGRKLELASELFAADHRTHDTSSSTSRHTQNSLPSGSAIT